MAIPDAVYSAVFLVFVILYSRKSRDISTQAKLKFSMPSQYAIQVYGIPRIVTNNSDLKKHFEKFGKVVEAVLVRNYNGTLFQHIESSNLINKITIEKKKLELRGLTSSKYVTRLEKKLLTTQQKIASQTQEMFGANLMHDDYPSIKGIVVFDTLQDKKNVLMRYRRFRGGCCKSVPRDMLFFGRKLRLDSYVDEPSNIRWENLDASTGDKCCRSCIVLILVICVMIMTFMIIFIANIVKVGCSSPEIFSCPPPPAFFALHQIKRDERKNAKINRKTLFDRASLWLTV